MIFVHSTPKERSAPSGWHKHETAASTRLTYVLLLAALLALLGGLYGHYASGVYTKDSTLVLTVVAGGIAGPITHEITHVFALPTRRRLRWTVVGFSPAVKYPVFDKISTPWMTVRLRQTRNEFVWVTLAPIVLLGVGAALLAPLIGGLAGLFLGGLAGANLLGARNDVCVVIDICKLGARHILDEPFGFYWR